MGDQSLAPWGNATTHNLESVLLAQIASSRYSAGLDSYEFNDLVDEIYNQARAHGLRACAPTLRGMIQAFARPPGTLASPLTHLFAGR
jgi:hypothetical protein